MRMTARARSRFRSTMREKLGLLPNSEVEFDIVG